MIPAETLIEEIAGTDIYLLDQLLKGRISKELKILDAGCGTARNIKYLLNAGYDVSAIDQNPNHIASLKESSPSEQHEKFITCSIEEAAFAEESFDYIICNAVLHFAKNDEHFDSMLKSLVKMLKPGGTFFSRLASSIGIENRVEPLGRNVFRLPDSSTRYLVDEAKLLSLTEAFGANLLDPIKTTVVQGQRAMTTWVFKKA